LLGFTLERLYADYGSGGRLTVVEYDKLGGVRGSIEAAVAYAVAEPACRRQSRQTKRRSSPLFVRRSFRGSRASILRLAPRCGAPHAATRSRKPPALSLSV
jgi:hypothetical protein